MKKSFESLLSNAIEGKASEEMAVKNNIIILEEFKNLIPPLGIGELAQLEENILNEGIREALIVWKCDSAYILLDGHNRFFISQKHGLNFTFRELEFKDKLNAKDWMIRNQLGRRNLSTEQQSYLRGLRYNSEKGQGKRTDLTFDQNDQKLNIPTAVKLSNEYNVSPATIRRDGEFAKALGKISETDPLLKVEILKGESSLSRKQIEARSKGVDSDEKNLRLPARKKISVSELANICYRYAIMEKRPHEDICSALGLAPDSINPIQYFELWSQAQQ